MIHRWTNRQSTIVARGKRSEKGSKDLTKACYYSSHTHTHTHTHPPFPPLYSTLNTHSTMPTTHDIARNQRYLLGPPTEAGWVDSSPVSYKLVVCRVSYRHRNILDLVQIYRLGRGGGSVIRVGYCPVLCIVIIVTISSV